MDDFFTKNGEPIQYLDTGHSMLGDVQFFQDEKRMMTIIYNGLIQIWEVEPKQLLEEFPSSLEKISLGRLSPDERYLALLDGSDWSVHIMGLADVIDISVQPHRFTHKSDGTHCRHLKQFRSVEVKGLVGHLAHVHLANVVDPDPLALEMTRDFWNEVVMQRDDVNVVFHRRDLTSHRKTTTEPIRAFKATGQ